MPAWVWLLILDDMRTLLILAALGAGVAVVPEPRPAPDLSGTWAVTSEVFFNGTSVLTSSDSSISWYDYDWTISGKKISYDVLYNDGANEQADFAFQMNAQQTPMWFDLVSEKHVEIGILKMEKDTITWHRWKKVPLAEWKKARGNIAGRPKDFTITETAGTSVLILKRKPK